MRYAWYSNALRRRSFRAAEKALDGLLITPWLGKDKSANIQLAVISKVLTFRYIFFASIALSHQDD